MATSFRGSSGSQAARCKPRSASCRGDGRARHPAPLGSGRHRAPSPHGDRQPLRARTSSACWRSRRVVRGGAAHDAAASSWCPARARASGRRTSARRCFWCSGRGLPRGGREADGDGTARGHRRGRASPRRLVVSRETLRAPSRNPVSPHLAARETETPISPRRPRRAHPGALGSTPTCCSSSCQAASSPPSRTPR